MSIRNWRSRRKRDEDSASRAPSQSSGEERIAALKDLIEASELSGSYYTDPDVGHILLELGVLHSFISPESATEYFDRADQLLYRQARSGDWKAMRALVTLRTYQGDDHGANMWRRKLEL